MSFLSFIYIHINLSVMLRNRNEQNPLFNHGCTVTATGSTSDHAEQYILRTSPVYRRVVWKSLSKNSQLPLSKFPFGPFPFLLMTKISFLPVMESLCLAVPLEALNCLCRVPGCFLNHLKLWAARRRISQVLCWRWHSRVPALLPQNTDLTGISVLWCETN